MLRGYTRGELTAGLSEDKSIYLIQRIMIQMLSKIISKEEVKRISKMKRSEVYELLKNPLNDEETKVYNDCWDLYVLMMHEQIATRSIGNSFRKFLNPFSTFFYSGTY